MNGTNLFRLIFDQFNYNRNIITLEYCVLDVNGSASHSWQSLLKEENQS